MTGERLAVLQVCSAREAIYGAVQSLLTLANGQREAGDRVEFLTFAGKRFGRQVRDLGYCVHEVKVRGKVDPIAIREMARVIRAGGYDVVHTHLSTSSVNGALAARLAKRPCVATVHGMSGKLSFAAAKHLIAVSGGVKNHLIRQGVSAKKITVVYNGVEVEGPVPSPQEARVALGLPPGGPILGTVARITRLKGIEHALRAVKILLDDFPDLRYVLAGDGDDLENCKALAAELGIAANIDFVGYRQDVTQCLASMDLFLFPSLKEAMGMAIVEAMAVGLPTVASDIGGIPEVVTPETGMLVPAGDPGALAVAVSELLIDPSRMQSFSKAAKERARDVFGIPVMIERTEGVYRRLLSE